MTGDETRVSELVEQLSDLPSDDDVQALTNSIEDLSRQIAASNSGTGPDRSEIREISREQAMRLLEHLTDPDCGTERCSDFREDLIALVNEHNSDAGSEEEVNEEESAELGEEDDDDPIFSDGGWETEQGRGGE